MVLRVTDWLLRAAIAVILVQTLWFKFSAAPESVWIFSQLRVEPWGRIAAGVFELVAALLVLWNRTVFFGALLALCAMLGAIVAHLAVLGVQVANDGGLLFVLACAVAAAAGAILLMHRHDLANQLATLRERLIRR